MMRAFGIIPAKAEAYLYRGFRVAGRFRVTKNSALEFEGASIPAGDWLFIKVDGEPDAYGIRYQADRIASGFHPSWWCDEQHGERLWYVPLRSNEWMTDDQVREAHRGLVVTDTSTGDYGPSTLNLD